MSYVASDESERKYGTFGGEDVTDSTPPKEEDLKDIVIETSTSQQEADGDGISRSSPLQKVSARVSELCKRFSGIFLAFMSGVMVTTYSSLIKTLDEIDPMQVVVMRGVLQFTVMGSIALHQRLSFRGTANKKVASYLFLLALTGGLNILFIFTSFARLPLGDATTVLFSSPVLVMVLSTFILNERWSVQC